MDADQLGTLITLFLLACMAGAALWAGSRGPAEDLYDTFTREDSRP